MLTPLRQFWAGVRALRSGSSKVDPRDLIYALNRLLVMRDRELVAEREAHEKTKFALSCEQGNHVDTAGALGEEAGTAIRLAQENRDLLEQLSTARADLDALTRWRKQSEEPCQVDGFWIETVRQGCRCCCCHLPVLRRDGPCATRVPERYSNEAAELVRSMGPVWDAAVRLKKVVGHKHEHQDQRQMDIERCIRRILLAVEAMSERGEGDGK